MLSIDFQDFRKNKTKEEKIKFHEMRVFELVFSEKIVEYGLSIDNIQMIRILCLANEKKNFTYQKAEEIGEVTVEVPYDFREFTALKSTEEKFYEFKRLIYEYVLPIFIEFSNFPEEVVEETITESLNQIVLQNYEIVFLVGKTPKKSPDRKKIAILRGVHQVSGFRLYCEVYNSKGIRILNKLLIKEVGNEGVYARFLGDMKWENESLITVKSRSSSWQEILEV